MRRAVFVLLMFAASASWGQIVFINEIHYDNSGADMGEFVEIAGKAGTDLSGWKVFLYNGNGGGVYGTIGLGGTLPDDGSGGGALFFPRAPIQNGSPDGMALVDDTGFALEFISYEGTIIATGGPAAGMMSIDIGVAEDSDTPIGSSLQRIDDGTEPMWVGPDFESPGSANAGQTLPVELVTLSVE